MTRRGVRWLVASFAVAALLAPGAIAAQPTTERFDIDESFTDQFLTKECGVKVTVHAEGHVILRMFDDGTGPVELVTINIALTATADGNTYAFRDVGADLIRVEPDGTAILMIVGQVPFEFTGLVKIDLETGEVIIEAKHSRGEEVEEACAVLTS